MKNRYEFSKLLLVMDYLLLIVLFILDVDSTVQVAWIAQIGVSSTAYYWKSKSDNRTKVPLKVISSLPVDMRENIDLTEVITAIIQSE